MTSNNVERAVNTLFSLFFQHNIDYAAHPLGLIPRRWIGDDLHPLNHAALQLRQSAGAFDTDQSGWLAVDENAYIAATSQTDIPLHIYGDRRHIGKNINRAAARIREIFAHVEYLFIQ
ncbi:hypothetical protein D3C87_1753580 [compost metagenome]